MTQMLEQHDFEPNVDEIVQHLEERDAESEDLDELVHEAASAIASAVNNDGIKAQVEFLVEQGFSTKDILDAVQRKVRCSLCGERVDKCTAHRHQGKWIGDRCCWVESLRTTE